MEQQISPEDQATFAYITTEAEKVAKQKADLQAKLRSQLFEQLPAGQRILNRFPNTQMGLPMLGCVQTIYREESNVTIPFFNAAGVFQLAARPTANPRKQYQTVEDDVESIEEHGYAPGVRGVPWAQRNPEAGGPYLMLSFDKLSQAIKIAYQRDTGMTNVKVQTTISRGLPNVDIFRPDAPLDALEFLVQYHNAFHSGSKTSWMEILIITTKAKANWCAVKITKGLTARDGKGAASTAAQCWEWVKDNFPGTYESENAWLKCCSLETTLNVTWGILQEMNTRIDNAVALTSLHGLSVVLKTLETSIDKEDLKIIFKEGAKFMVPTRPCATGATYCRDINWIFEKTNNAKIKWLQEPLGTLTAEVRWLDDLVDVWKMAVAERPEISLKKTPDVLKSYKRQLYSLGLKFAWEGQITLVGTTYKKWSVLKKALKTMVDLYLDNNMMQTDFACVAPQLADSTFLQEEGAITDAASTQKSFAEKLEATRQSLTEPKMNNKVALTGTLIQVLMNAKTDGDKFFTAYPLPAEFDYKLPIVDDAPIPDRSSVSSLDLDTICKSVVTKAFGCVPLSARLFTSHVKHMAMLKGPTDVIVPPQVKSMFPTAEVLSYYSIFRVWSLIKMTIHFHEESEIIKATSEQLKKHDAAELLTNIVQPYEVDVDIYAQGWTAVLKRLDVYLKSRGHGEGPASLTKEFVTMIEVGLAKEKKFAEQATTSKVDTAAEADAAADVKDPELQSRVSLRWPLHNIQNFIVGDSSKTTTELPQAGIPQYMLPALAGTRGGISSDDGSYEGFSIDPIGDATGKKAQLWYEPTVEQGTSLMFAGEVSAIPETTANRSSKICTIVIGGEATIPLCLNAGLYGTLGTTGTCVAPAWIARLLDAKEMKDVGGAAVDVKPIDVTYRIPPEILAHSPTQAEADIKVKCPTISPNKGTIGNAHVEVTRPAAPKPKRAAKRGRAEVPASVLEFIGSSSWFQHIGKNQEKEKDEGEGGDQKGKRSRQQPSNKDTQHLTK
ncbi:unnamed protein product [Prorocentrum cordatum]|uniref:Uncharacterized protein n=1 Tax=Prorocentrum cordatum TaxID=2364126 RepID=A0ABN9VZM1_9DINO|nr:unnamed protein product [Polarella glacialis]